MCPTWGMGLGQVLGSCMLPHTHTHSVRNTRSCCHTRWHTHAYRVCPQHKLTLPHTSCHAIPCHPVGIAVSVCKPACHTSVSLLFETSSISNACLTAVAAYEIFFASPGVGLPPGGVPGTPLADAGSLVTSVMSPETTPGSEISQVAVTSTLAPPTSSPDSGDSERPVDLRSIHVKGSVYVTSLLDT